MKKVFELYRVGMKQCSKRVHSLEEALSLKPEWEFRDPREKRKYSSVAIVKPEKEIEAPEQAIIPEDNSEANEKPYDDMSKPEKKDVLEKIAREHGVELDKRKKLEDLEEIVNKLIEG